jgi:hypothetical protein
MIRPHRSTKYVVLLALVLSLHARKTSAVDTAKGTACDGSTLGHTLQLIPRLYCHCWQYTDTQPVSCTVHTEPKKTKTAQGMETTNDLMPMRCCESACQHLFVPECL